MGIISIITLILYWVLSILWAFIFAFYITRLRKKNIRNSMFVILFTVLSFDAFRTLFESVYFGLTQASLRGVIEEKYFRVLYSSWATLIPKGLNLAVAITVIVILLKKWVPRESERLWQYRSTISSNDFLLNQLPVSVIITDLNGKIEYVNRYCTELTGYSEEELLGASPGILKNSRSRSTDYKELWETISAGKVWKGRFLNQKKDGTLYYEDAVISPVFNDNGEATNYLGIKEDITDSVEMQNSYEKVHTVVEQTYDSVEILDRQGNIEYVNRAFVNTTGYTKEEALGKNPLELFWDGNMENKTLQEDLWKTVNQGIPWTGRFTNRIKDGSYITEELSTSPVFNKSGEIINFATVKRNITEQIRAEEEQKLIKDQLFHAQKVESVGQLAGGVAHDFNNILSSIITAASLLEDPSRNLDEKSRKYVDMIMKSSYRAADLTGRLLSISRRGRSEEKPFSLQDVVKETINLLHFSIDKKISITSEVNIKDDIVFGDQSVLQSSLLNLGINASHAVGGDGKIHFTLTGQYLDSKYCKASPFAISPGEYCRLSVSDNGEGIPEENISQIFDPFFTTKESGKGTGLGLFSAINAVKEFKGEISVKSRVGEGTVFTIFIPLAQSIEKGEAPTPDSLRGSETILIVDDEEFNRSLGKEILESLGYTVLLAENGAEALTLYEKSHDSIDLIILDMNMPVMDGRDAYIKIHEINENARIILASGYADDNKLKDLFDLGLQDFLSKPYRISDFSSLIRKVLDRSIITD